MHITFTVKVKTLLEAADLEEACQTRNLDYSYTTEKGTAKNFNKTVTGIKRPVVTKEKRREIASYIRKHKNALNKNIAKRFKVSVSTVSRVRLAITSPA
jgi:predicted transcriptional regulator